jgi:hypothetical protein
LADEAALARPLLAALRELALFAALRGLLLFAALRGLLLLRGLRLAVVLLACLPDLLVVAIGPPFQDYSGDTRCWGPDNRRGGASAPRRIPRR